MHPAPRTPVPSAHLAFVEASLLRWATQLPLPSSPHPVSTSLLTQALTDLHARGLLTDMQLAPRRRPS